MVVATKPVIIIPLPDPTTLTQEQCETLFPQAQVVLQQIMTVKSLEEEMSA